MNVNNNDEFMGAGLEEQMFHVCEKDVDLATTMVTISQTIAMNFDFTSNTFAIQTGSNKNIVEILRFTIWV